ncbi:MAG TPA: DUF4922 domain-containing protein [Blastocatellia bacterium]|nr:DUF4922 domain-containing protein [Blastocatellia bacterium]
MRWDDRLISAHELAPYVKRDGGPPFGALAAALVEHQKEHWLMMREGYDAFAQIEAKRFDGEGWHVIVQHNPRRINSTSARVDADSVQARPCFLCSENLPDDEEGIPYGEELVILCNPFPVLDRHLSIVHREHVEQKIEGNVEQLLRLAMDLGPEYFVLYNGPRCGASAPDHLHFQACSRALLPIEEDMLADQPDAAAHCDACDDAARGEFELFTLSTCGRTPVVFRGGVGSQIAEWIYRTIAELRGDPDADEPMINIICTHDRRGWTVFLFPRARHRPACFFEEGDDRLIVSPGAIDMAGVVVVPEARHFARIGAAEIEAIFSEVSLPGESVNDLVERGCDIANMEGVY